MALYPNLSNHNQSSPGTTLIPLNILVYEEDYGFSEHLRTLLEPESYHVTSASSVPEGTRLAACDSPDVMVLVLDLPDQDGLDVCRRFRSCSNAPILVLSSNGRPNFAEQALDAGADDYLVKPVNSTLMIASLNKLFRRARVTREAGKLNDDPAL